MIGDFQSNIVVGSTGITGNLAYISDYSAAGYYGDEASGNFLVLHASVPNVEGVTITGEVVGGIHGQVTLDPDGILISRIASTTQQIRFIASKSGYSSVTKTFDLTGLILAGS